MSQPNGHRNKRNFLRLIGNTFKHTYLDFLNVLLYWVLHVLHNLYLFKMAAPIYKNRYRYT